MTGIAPDRRNRVRARLAACVAALLVLFGARGALAATSVPMCGEHAETVVAPPSSRPASNASLREGPCDARDDSAFRGGLPNQAPEPRAGVDTVPRLPPVFFRLPPVPRSRVAVDPAPSAERPAHRSAIERPPR